MRVAPSVAPTAPSPARSVGRLRSAIAGRSDREPSCPGRARFALGAVGTICHRGSQPGRSSCHHQPDAGQPGPGAVVARRASYRPFQTSARYLDGHSRTRREAGGARRPGEPLPLCRSSLRCGCDLDVLPLRHYADQEVALAARHSVRGARRQRRCGAPGVAGCEDLVRGEVGSDLLLRRPACAAGQPAYPLVRRRIGLPASDRKFPPLTGRSGTQRARRLLSRTRPASSAPWSSSPPSELRITSVFPCLARGFKARASFMFAGCCWW